MPENPMLENSLLNIFSKMFSNLKKNPNSYSFIFPLKSDEKVYILDKLSHLKPILNE